MTELIDRTRLLAIDPCYRGFGFAVLEGPDELIEWGLKSVPTSRDLKFLTQVAYLIRRFEPDVLVVEDCRAPGSRRSAHVADLLRRVRLLARQRGVKVAAVSARRARAAFPLAKNKHQLAATMAGRFPELAPHVPPPRKCWMSEDPRTTIFDALALATTANAARGEPISGAILNR